jgi:GrpB-like predicted nucleotidyltransferase (UPF0157 family)
MTASHERTQFTKEQIRSHTVGALQILNSKILIVDYDPQWPEIFRREADHIRNVLEDRAISIEHTGSTSVPDLAAKPIIDIVLVVADSAAEKTYVPALESIDYTLRIREPAWYEHRMLKKVEPAINLHVFSLGCPELDRMLSFRDWLRNNSADRELYARTKRNLAKQEWKYVQNYADAKSAIVAEIMKRALKAGANRNPS